MKIVCSAWFSNIDWTAFGTWILALITLLGIFLALRQFKYYRREICNNMFIEFRQRFKSDPINVKVFDFIQNNYEELHRMLIEKQISLDDVIYYFGNYYIKIFEHKDISALLKRNSKYWTRAVDLYCLVSENEIKVLTKISNKFNQKNNLNILENKIDIA
jgi:hypothetical protein